MGGECVFEECYNGNPLVNVFALGVAKKDEIFYAKASGIGNPVIYVGAKTGRDGIHGASMASAEFTEESKQKRPNVQVGDPFLEKLLLEACLEAMQTGAIVGIQDMGAAGLTCSTCEMGSRGETGIEIDLDLRAAARDRHDGVRDHALGIAGAHAAGGGEGPRGGSLPRLPQVGTGRGDDRPGDRRRPAARAASRRDRGGDSEPPLADKAPLYDRPHTKPLRTAPMEAPAVPEHGSDARIWKRCWRRRTSAPSAGSGSSTITWCAPTRSRDRAADAAIVRVKETGTSIAMSLDGNGRYCYLSPREGAKLIVAECCRNLATVGAVPMRRDQ